MDPEDNVWVTDVALHQVFKFPPRGGDGHPLIELGTAFHSGNTKDKFCKPTAVAVLENGDFFVADGYCNARIIKYSKTGNQILVWGRNSFSGISFDVAPENFFAIPHALTLVPELDLLCIADRENGRVQCFYTNNGTFHSQYHNPLIGDRLFSMAYTPASGECKVISCFNCITIHLELLQEGSWLLLMDPLQSWEHMYSITTKYMALC